MRMGYRETLAWLLDNEDTEWLEHSSENGQGALPISAALAADIFGKTDEALRKDILRLQEKRNR